MQPTPCECGYSKLCVERDDCDPYHHWTVICDGCRDEDSFMASGKTRDEAVSEWNCAKAELES